MKSETHLKLSSLKCLCIFTSSLSHQYLITKLSSLSFFSLSVSQSLSLDNPPPLSASCSLSQSSGFCNSGHSFRVLFDLEINLEKIHERFLVF